MSAHVLVLNLSEAQAFASILQLAGTKGRQDDFVDLLQWLDLVRDEICRGDDIGVVRIAIGDREHADAAEGAILWCMDDLRPGGRLNAVDAIAFRKADMSDLLERVRQAGFGLDKAY